MACGCRHFSLWLKNRSRCSTRKHPHLSNKASYTLQLKQDVPTNESRAFKFKSYPAARACGNAHGGRALEWFNVIKDSFTSGMSPRGQWKEKCGCDSSLSRDSIRGLPLPPSCLLPLGHTAVLRCQPERVFSQIASSNYSRVFWAISSSSSPSLILTCGLSLYFVCC